MKTYVKVDAIASNVYDCKMILRIYYRPLVKIA